METKRKLGPEDRLNLRIPKELVKKVRIKAITNDTTISALIVGWMYDYVGEKRPESPKKKK